MQYTNSDRARSVIPALLLKAEKGWEPGPLDDPDHGHQALGDLLCDLRHLAARIGVDFDAASLRGARHYEAEESGQDGAEAGDWAFYVERS